LLGGLRCAQEVASPRSARRKLAWSVARSAGGSQPSVCAKEALLVRRWREELLNYGLVCQCAWRKKKDRCGWLVADWSGYHE